MLLQKVTLKIHYITDNWFLKVLHSRTLSNAPVLNNSLAHNSSDASISNSSSDSMGLNSASAQISILPNNSHTQVPNTVNISSNTIHSDPSTSAHQTSYICTETPNDTDDIVQLEWTDFLEEFDINDIHKNSGN